MCIHIYIYTLQFANHFCWTKLISPPFVPLLLAPEQAATLASLRYRPSDTAGAGDFTDHQPSDGF